MKVPSAPAAWTPVNVAEPYIPEHFAIEAQLHGRMNSAQTPWHTLRDARPHSISSRGLSLFLTLPALDRGSSPYSPCR
jgi:hypothetical protein